MTPLPVHSKLNVINCTACDLRKEAIAPVPGDLVRSRLMIVGRNPGKTEDKTGAPFKGRGGGLLNHALQGALIDRTKISITNLAKCHTTDDRPPDLTHYTTCFANHLLHEINQYVPTHIVALGNDCFQFLSATKHSVNEQRQVWIPRRFYFNSDRPNHYWDVMVLGIVHPGSAARSGTYKAQMYEDFIWLVSSLPKEIRADIQLR